MGSEHPLNSQSDIEVVNAWIEYSNLLGELGFYKQSLDNVENMLTWLNEIVDGEMSGKENPKMIFYPIDKITA